MKVILDTNFLVYCAEKKIDYFELIDDLPANKEIVVIRSVLNELKDLKQNAKKAKDKAAASLALQIVDRNIKGNNLEVLEIEDYADDVIKRIANREDIVATMDRQLKSKLKGKARILSIRSAKKLEIV